MNAWWAVLLAVVAMMVAVGGVGAVVPPDPSRTPEDLQAVFPGVAQLPHGMALQEAGERTEAEIAASFLDPEDAATDLVIEQAELLGAELAA